mmetsp:Transcript_20907/g.57138  ORF Transcript_20907/g.57138 Transcript_20907/m.57138 type:complete len:280 (-) Transcript_20907:268-1107(-)
MRLGDVVDAVDKHHHVLRLGLQHRLVEDGIGALEDAHEEAAHEVRGDAVAQAAGQHLPAVQLEVINLLKEAILDHVHGVALLLAHAAPDLGHEEADVVVDLAPADVAGGAREARVAREDHAHERRVQVGSEGQRVEGALGECALGSGASGGRRLPSEAAHKLHEELRQVLEVDGVEDRQGADGRAVGKRVRGVVPAAGQDAGHWEMHGLAKGDAAPQAGGDLSDTPLLGLAEVGADLEVAGVGRGPAVHDAEVVRAHDKLLLVGLLRCRAQPVLHVLGE